MPNPNLPIIINGPRMPIIIEGNPAPPTPPPTTIVAPNSGSAMGSSSSSISASGSGGGWTLDLGNGAWAIAWGSGVGAVSRVWALAWGPSGTSLRNLAWQTIKAHIEAHRTGSAYLSDGVTPRFEPLISAALGDASIAIGLDGPESGVNPYPGWSGPTPSP